MNTFRQTQIKEYIERNYIVTIKELQQLIPDVSLMTIHRDLDALEQIGAIVKVRGGARAVRHSSDLGFDIRIQENISDKNIIADKALQLIQQGSTVFLDASTTNLILARNLPDIPLNVITTCPNIAISLCNHPNVHITLCGGTLNRKNMALSGQTTLDMLQDINIDMAFIGVSGCSVEAGFTCGTEGDMLIKKYVIHKARTSVVLCDHSKFSRLMPYTFAHMSDIECLISDDKIPTAIAQLAHASDVMIY